MKAIYFATYSNGKIQSDSGMTIHKHPSLEGFTRWVEAGRLVREQEHGGSFTVLSINYITSDE